MKQCLDQGAGEGDLELIIGRWVNQRTSGRVHCLRVETVGERVVVHGHAGSYHVRQLALAAALEALEPFQAERSVAVEFDITVHKKGLRGW